MPLSCTGSSYSLTQVKSYDVWGGVRSGALGPSGRYCGNLGHVSDDESGLIYMRARYYEPGSGRFVSEDPAMDGQNWYAYCGNDPVGRVDRTGEADELTQNWAYILYWATVGGYTSTILNACKTSKLARVVAFAGIAMLYDWFCGGNGSGSIGQDLSGFIFDQLLPTSLAGIAYVLTLSTFGLQLGSVKDEAIGVFKAYSATITLFLALCQIEESFR